MLGGSVESSLVNGSLGSMDQATTLAKILGSGQRKSFKISERFSRKLYVHSLGITKYTNISIHRKSCIFFKGILRATYVISWTMLVRLDSIMVYKREALTPS